MSQTIHHRLHILEAADWKDGVITLLAPSSPYRPWRYAFGEARAGDDAFTGWRLDDEKAERVILAVHEVKVYGSPYNRCGHSSLVAARTLLQFGGNCRGCGAAIDLSAPDARDLVHVHTVDPSRRRDPHNPIRTPEDAGKRWLDPLRSIAMDWPGVICRDCREDMRDGGFTSLMDFVFARHPQCPQCGGRRSRRIHYGMPADPQSWAPWISMGGCCVSDEDWHCDLCGYEWE